MLNFLFSFTLKLKAGLPLPGFQRQTVHPSLKVVQYIIPDSKYSPGSKYSIQTLLLPTWKSLVTQTWATRPNGVEKRLTVTLSGVPQVSSFSQVVSAKVEQAKDAAGSIRVPGINRDRCLTLLVIDDADTDWSKYFRGRRLFAGEFDVRVEQAEFRELTVSAGSESGVTASIVMHKTGSKVVRSG